MKKLSVKQQQGIILAVVVIIGFVVIGKIMSGYLYEIYRYNNFLNNPKYIIKETVCNDDGKYLSLKGNHKLIDFFCEKIKATYSYDAKYIVDDWCYNNVILQMREIGAIENEPLSNDRVPDRLIEEEPELWFDDNKHFEAEYIFSMEGQMFESDMAGYSSRKIIAVILYEESGHKIVRIIRY